MSVVYELRPPRRAPRLLRRAALGALALVVLAWTPPQRGAHPRDVPGQAEVAAGSPATLEDGSKVAELAAPQLLGARIERDGEAIVLLFELERAVPHWLERDAAAHEVDLVLESVRLARPLAWLDFSATPIRSLDVRRVDDALHLAIGLEPEARVEVQSAMLELSAGARLMLQIVERAPDPAAAAPAPLVSKRPLDRGGQDGYREALRLERAGDATQARALLRSVLAQQPGHTAARAHLVESLAAAGRPAEALRVLRAGAKRGADPRLAKVEARLLVEQRKDDEAIAALERALPKANDDPEYHSFLAALLQRRGDHERAAALFQIAVSEEPSRASSWLGLAISQDARGESAEALDSLRRVLSLGGLDPEARRWAEGRLRALRAEAPGAKP